jgi:3-oxoacyl-[acyl-carrier protein] reductase
MRTVLITGAKGGIGSLLASAFEARGYEVHAPGRECAVHQPWAIENYLSLSGLVKVDVLVNNAAITKDALISKMGDDEWGEVLRTNLTGAFNMIRAVIPKMKGGNIVNVGSVVGERGAFGCANYAAAKAGLVGLTKSAAIECARSGTCVNLLSLGYFDAGMGSRLPPKIREAIEQTIPFKKFGDPQEAVNAALFLAEVRYMTGATLSVTGGL